MLCLVHGYLTLLAGVAEGDADFSDAWNLGPSTDGAMTVENVARRLQAHWPDLNIEVRPEGLHEAKLLTLDSTKARKHLGWKPAWDAVESIDRTAQWYGSYLLDPASAAQLTLDQLATYRATLAG